MFKKGQLVRSKRTGNLLHVHFIYRMTPNAMWVQSIKTGRKLCVPTCEMELIGNNYKEIEQCLRKVS